MKFVRKSRLSSFSTTYIKTSHEKLLAVLNAIIELAFRDSTRGNKNVFNNTSNWIKTTERWIIITILWHLLSKLEHIILKTVSLILDLKFLAKLLVFPWVPILLFHSLPINLYLITNLNVYVKWNIPANIHLFKVNNRNTRRCEICSKLTIKTPERSLRRHLIIIDHHWAWKFEHVYRFINDIITMNNKKDFEHSFKIICLEKLGLKKENANDNNVTTFLNVSITVKKGENYQQLIR